MIPESLIDLIEKQGSDVFRRNQKAALSGLEELGVLQGSEFHRVFLDYYPANFKSSVSYEFICDVCEPTNEVKDGTDFIHDVWGLPDNFICFTSLQGEGGYLLDKITGQVWDFDLDAREEFMSGKTPATWGGFFEFLTWFLS